MTDLPRVTIVIVTKRMIADPVVVEMIYAAEHQDYPSDLTDINIVLAPDDMSETDASRLGVERATTEWVSVMREGEDWNQDHIIRLAQGIGYSYPFAHTVRSWSGGVIYRKDQWLRINK